MHREEFQRLIEKVKVKSDIVKVIGERIDLKNNKAICPFHKEKTPSFAVNPQEQYFYCFGCRRGGDVIRFIELYEGITFWEAICVLATEANINIKY